MFRIAIVVSWLEQENTMSYKVEDSPVQTQSRTNPQLDLPEGIPPLRSLYLYIAGACNLACRHCWIVPTFLKRSNGKFNITNGKFLKLELVEKAILEAKPLGLATIKLTGGEPLLHPQFRELVDLINDEGLDMVIETNGTLIDDELAAWLKQKNVSHIAVSLDGATAATHDYLRNVAGSYDDTLRGIQALVKAGFSAQVICTLHRDNVAEAEQLVVLAEEMGCGSVKFNHIQRIGRGKNFGEQKGFTVDEVIRLHQQIDQEISARHRIRIYFDIPFAFRSIRGLWSQRLTGCHIHNILGILDGGEVALCGIGVTLPDLVYGYLEKDNLQDLWRNHPRLRLLREQIPTQIEGICAQCIHQDKCLGHCVAHNYQVSTRLNAPFQFCAHADEMGLFPVSRKKEPVAY
jgi:SynChlorMet cassette radical SAM/SPASM protein ScmF